MGLLSSNKKQSELLAKAASDAVSVFQTTIIKLKDVVESAKKSKDENQKSIDALVDENTKLDKVIADNTIMASKLSDLFNPQTTSSSSDGSQ